MKRWMSAITCLAVFLLMAGPAMAQGWVAGNAATEKEVYVEADAANKDAANLDADIEYELDQNLTSNDLIELTLENATFAEDPTLTGEGDSSIDLLSGGTGENYARFRVVGAENGVDAGNVLTLDSLNAIFDVSELVEDEAVNINLAMETAFGDPIDAVNSDYASTVGANLFVGKSAANVAVTEESDTATVAAENGPFTLFDNTVEEGTETALAFENAASEGNVPDAANFAEEQILFTITGDFEGIDSVTAGNVTGSDATGDTAAGNPDEFLINEDMDAAYAVNTEELVAGDTIDVNPQFIIDGETSQLERDFQVEVTVSDGDPWDAFTALAATDLYTIERDGSTRVLPNIPGGTDTDPGVGDKAFVRITNPTGIDGAVFGTMYDQDGNVVGERGEVMIDSLEADQTIVMSNDDLRSIFGDWEKRARLVIDAEITDLGVMGLIRTPAGTLHNMSSGAGNNW